MRSELCVTELSVCERALFTGFRNLVIEQFEYESTRESEGRIWKDLKMTHRPAGLLSTEMSKNVRFLTTMVADGKRLEGRAFGGACCPALVCYRYRAEGSRL